MVTRADLADTAEPIFLIALGDITVSGDRLRSLKPAAVAAFATALDADGQYDPIAVAQLPGRADFVLVDGLHRLEGARALSWASIAARIVDANAADRRRREILSEFVRASSDVFDHAAQIKALSQLARAGGIDMPNAPRDVAECAIIAQVLKWDDLTAQTLGISRRSVFDALKIAETFDATWIARLRATGHAEQLVPLLALAKEESRTIARVIAWLEADHDRTIAEGIAAVTAKAAPTAADKRFSAVIGNLGRMADAERARVVDRVVAQYLTTEQLEAILAARRSGTPR